MTKERELHGRPVELKPYDISESEYERTINSTKTYPRMSAWRVLLAILAILVVGAVVIFYPQQLSDFMNGTAEEQRQNEINKRHLFLEVAFNECVKNAGQKGPVSGDAIRACKEVADSLYPEGSNVSL